MLYKLDDDQFKGLINSLLTPIEQDSITAPVTRESLLNDMRLLGKLDSIEKFLAETYPDLFPKTSSKVSLNG